MKLSKDCFKDSASNKYELHNSYILKKKYLQMVFNRRVSKNYGLKNIQLKHAHVPRPNATYINTENKDHTMAMKKFKKICKEFTTVKTENRQDEYSEDMAHIHYLQSRPVSFIFLGKFTSCEVHIARALADYWKCHFIDPESLINNEINSESAIGKYLGYNLRRGHSIGPEILSKLIEIKINTEEVLHRGFILTDFPLVPASNFQINDPLSNVLSTCIAHECLTELLNIVDVIVNPPSNETDEEGEKENQDTENIDDLESKLSKQSSINIFKKDISEIFAIDTEQAFSVEPCLERHVKKILSFMKTPFMTVYFTCPPEDITNARRKLLLHKSKLTANAKDREKYSDFDKTNAINILSAFNFDGYDIKLPNTWKRNITDEVFNYETYVLPVINNFVLQQDPQYVMKVDGRILPSKLFHAIIRRLKMLPLQPVLIPQPCFVATIDETENSPPENPYTGRTPDECFEELSELNCVGPKYRWKKSSWGFRCPVSLKEGAYINGNPEFAVQFLDKIFFLASEEAMRSFCENPRQYLLPPLPSPRGQICVMGAKATGKTTLCYFLAYLLNAVVIDFKQKEAEYIAYQEELNNIKVHERLVIEGKEYVLEKLMKPWEEAEEIRQKNEEEWKQTFVQYCNNFLTMCEQFDEFQAKDEFDAQFKAHNLPSPDFGFCTLMIEKENEIMQYLPDELKEPAPKPIVEDNDSEVIEFVEQALPNIPPFTYIMANSDYIKVLIHEIESAEETLYQRSEGEMKTGGWIIDNFPVNLEVIQMLQSTKYPNIDFVYLRIEDPENYPKEKLSDAHRSVNLEEISQRIKQKTIDILSHISHSSYAWMSTFMTSILKDDEILEYLKFSKQDSISDIIEEDNQISDVTVDSQKTASSKQSDESKKTVDSKMDTKKSITFRKSIQSEKTSSKSISEPSKTKVIELSPSQIIFNEKTVNMNREWEDIKSYLGNNLCGIDVGVDKMSLSDVLYAVIRDLEAHYQLQATVLTEEEKDRIRQDFMAESDENEVEEQNQYDDRRFGETLKYCPVILHNHGVLCNGKEEFAAQINGKIYLLSSAESLNQFVGNPRKYIEFNKPADDVPKPRICIVGAFGCQKTKVAKQIANSLGLLYINYLEYINKFFLRTGFHHVGREHEPGFVKKVIEPPDDFNQDIYNTDGDIIVPDSYPVLYEMFRRYVTEGSPMPFEIMKYLIGTFWFQEPYVSIGIVLDGFPSNEFDFNLINRIFAFPDLIVAFNVPEEEIQQRNVKSRLHKWKKEIRKAKFETNVRNHRIMEAVKFQRQERLLELVLSKEIDYIIAQIIHEHQEDSAQEDDENEKNAPEDIDMTQFDEILDKEHPLPVFDETWETDEEAKARFEEDVQNWYTYDMGVLEKLEARATDSLVPWIVLDETKKSVKNILSELMIIVMPFKFRNESVFEKVYDILPEETDLLLSKGYYYLSKFARTCPVQVYEREIPIQMYFPLVETDSVCPVVHKQYLYFVNRKNIEKFKNNPLEYIYQPLNFPLIPLRVAVIGPPKCGKSTLAMKLSKYLDLKVITRGQSIRYILDNLSRSSLGMDIDRILKTGNTLPSDLIMKSVECYCSDEQAVTQGLIFDGFPCSQKEIIIMESLGLIPFIIIDLEASNEFSSNCLAFENKSAFQVPVYSQQFLSYKYSQWLNDKDDFRLWVKDRYQNFYQIKCGYSKWSVLEEAKEIIFETFMLIITYLNDLNPNKPMCLEGLPVSLSEIESNLDQFKKFCPGCLLNQIFVEPISGLNRKYIIQYNQIFYCLCKTHVEYFLLKPQNYLTAESIALLAKETPRRGDASEFPLYEDGFCIVTFWDSLPVSRLVKGNPKFCIVYRSHKYIFQDEECMDKFLRHPNEYAGRHIYFKESQMNATSKPLAPILCKNLPTLGFLEQFHAKLITQACTHIGMFRPKFPGMNATLSAILYLAMYLKIHSPMASIHQLQLYEKLHQEFKEKCLLLKKIIKDYKSTFNPFMLPQPDIVFSKISLVSSDHSKVNEEVEEEQKPVCICQR